VGVEKLAAVRLERATASTGDRELRFPAVDDDAAARLSTAAMTRSTPNGIRELFREREIGAPSLKSDEPAMICFAPASSSSCARAPSGHRRRRSTTARGKLTHDREVVAFPIAASRSITALSGTARTPHPFQDVVVSNRKALALHQLHDAALCRSIDGMSTSEPDRM